MCSTPSGSINHDNPTVLIGQVRPDSQNDYWRIAPPARTAKTTTVSDQEQVTAGDLGAVFVVLSRDGSFQGPFTNMNQVKSTNILPRWSSIPEEVLKMKFPFIKVEDLAWAGSGRMSIFLRRFHVDICQRVHLSQFGTSSSFTMQLASMYTSTTMQWRRLFISKHGRSVSARRYATLVHPLCS